MRLMKANCTYLVPYIDGNKSTLEMTLDKVETYSAPVRIRMIKVRSLHSRNMMRFYEINREQILEIF